MCKSPKEHWIREVLSNDEVSTNDELIAYFQENGLSKEEAVKRVGERSTYACEIIACDDAPENFKLFCASKMLRIDKNFCK